MDFHRMVGVDRKTVKRAEKNRRECGLSDIPRQHELVPGAEFSKSIRKPGDSEGVSGSIESRGDDLEHFDHSVVVVDSDEFGSHLRGTFAADHFVDPLHVVIVPEREAEAGRLESEGGEGRGFAGTSRHQLSLPLELRVRRGMSDHQGGDLVGELRTEDRHSIADPDDRSSVDGAFGERAAVLQAYQSGGLRNDPVGRGPDGADEPHFLRHGEEQADMFLSLAASDSIEGAQRRGRGRQVIAGMGSKNSSIAAAGDLRRGERPSADVSIGERRMTAGQPDRHGLEGTSLVGLSKLDDPAPGRDVVPIEEFDSSALEVGIMDAAPKLGFDRSFVDDRVHHESRVIEVGGDQQGFWTGSSRLPGLPGDQEVPVGIPLPRETA